LLSAFPVVPPSVGENAGLYVMGVFERHDCNYEHLFGQAFPVGGNVETARHPWADRFPLRGKGSRVR